MRQNWGGDEGFFEFIESVPTLVRELPGNSLSSETSDDDLRVVVDEPPVKVCEAQKGLDVADLPGFGPFLNTRDLGRVHGEAVRRENKS